MASILVFYSKKTAELLKEGIPLERAKKFCNLQDTHSNTWFCGFRDEDDTGLSPISTPSISAHLHKVYNDMR